MTDLLTIDIGRLTAGGSPGPTASRDARRDRFRRFQESLARDELPISGPVQDLDTAAAVRGLAAKLRGRYDQVLVVGIGGSTLGFRAISNFLRGPLHNVFPGGHPRVFVVDNVDPAVTQALVSSLDFGKVLLIYISKSGSTPEPAANFLVFFDRLVAAGAAVEDTVVVCDPGDNGINRIAATIGCHLLHIPPALPGRYSVLSSVGLLPAELVGVDSGELLRGARVAHDAALETEPESNPCFLLTDALHHHLSTGSRNVHFHFSYSNLLAEFNLWFIQLWSESLGKLNDLAGRQVRTGAMPVGAVGATDQHSVLQLLKEGPLDKVIGFVKIAEFPEPVAVPKAFPELDEYAYFGGHTLAEQLAIEQLSTEISVVRAGHPCYSIALRDVSPAALGCLFYFWELVVVFYAALENINPFDQPGVEEGKKMTYTLMGRREYAAHQETERAALAEYARSSQATTLG